MAAGCEGVVRELAMFWNSDVVFEASPLTLWATGPVGVVGGHFLSEIVMGDTANLSTRWCELKEWVCTYPTSAQRLRCLAILRRGDGRLSSQARRLSSYVVLSWST